MKDASKRMVISLIKHLDDDDDNNNKDIKLKGFSNGVLRTHVRFFV